MQQLSTKRMEITKNDYEINKELLEQLDINGRETIRYKKLEKIVIEQNRRVSGKMR